MRTIYLFIVLLFVLLQGCVVTRERCNQLYPPVVAYSIDTFLFVKENLLHDTVYVPADNAEFEIMLEADSNSIVQLVSVKSKSGKRSAINYRTHRGSKTLRAVFTCQCDSLAIYRMFKTIDTTLNIATTQTKIHQVNVPAQFTWWQLFKIGYGGYAMLLIGLYLTLKIAWWVLKTYTKIQLPFTGLF